MAETSVSSRRNRELLFGGAAIGTAVLLVAVLVLFAGAKLDAPTLSLAAACATLLYALRGLFAVVVALSRPGVEVVLATAPAGGRALSELRDEKKRVLRAIKELDFDYGVGKLSDADYEEIRGKYQVRAVEVMRELDAGGGLHPEVQKILDGNSVEATAAEPDEAPAPPEAAASKAAPAPGADASVPDMATTRVCSECERGNDLDSKFCKHCGAPLEAGA